MKKFLSLFLVFLMMLSSVIPAFAVREEDIPEGKHNTPQFWLSDGIVDENNQVTLTFSVKNNPGFWSARTYLVYPECLKIVEDDNWTGIYGDGEVIPDYISTNLPYGKVYDIADDPQAENSKWTGFRDCLNDPAAMQESFAADENGYIDYSETWGEGYLWMGGLHVESSDFVNCVGDGAMYQMTFTYFPELNTTGAKELKIDCVFDVAGSFALDEELLDFVEFDGYEVYGGTVTVGGKTSAENVSDAFYINGAYHYRGEMDLGKSQTWEFDLWLENEDSEFHIWADTASTRYTIAYDRVGVWKTADSSGYEEDDFASIEWSEYGVGFDVPGWHRFKVELNVDGKDRIYKDGILVWTGSSTAKSYWETGIIFDSYNLDKDIIYGVAIDNLKISGTTVYGPYDFENGDFGLFSDCYQGNDDSKLIKVCVAACQHNDKVLINQINPTCTESGYTGDWSCRDCGTVVQEGTAVEPAGHMNEFDRAEYVDGNFVYFYKCSMCEAETASDSLGENDVMFWMSNGIINKDNKVTLTLNIENNPGFWSSRICIIYPECLKIADESNIAAYYKDNGSGDVLTSYESTGLDAGLGFDINEDPQSENTNYPEFAQLLDYEGIDYSEQFGDGYLWLGAIYMENPEFSNFEGDGALFRFTFNYDESLNTSGDEEFEFFVIVDDSSTYKFDEEAFDLVEFDEVQSYNGYAMVCKHPAPVEQNRIEPTCETDGFYEIYCPDCQRILESVEIAALGHDVKEWIVDSEPTCFEDGMEYGECERCYQTIENVLDMLIHTADDWEIVTEAGPFNTGYRIKTCIYCEMEMENEVIPMTKEDFGLRADNDGGFITEIPGGITADLFIEHYKNMGLDVSVVNSAGNVPRYIGTGCIVTCSDMSFTIVVSGDISGDGLIDARDSFFIKRILTFSLNPNSAQSMAADLDGNEKVNAKDNFTLKKIITGRN